jgi:Zn-dependent peptidase ImmA (M78 family)/DNA-binding XRE family transcriptional regulator
MTDFGTNTIELRERIRRIRLVRRWDQGELAARSQCSAATISQIETGRLNPTDAQVEQIAVAFGYTAAFLGSDLGLVPTSRPWLRAYADASRKEADARTEACGLAVEYVRRLGLKPLPDLLPALGGDVEDDEALEEIALEVRCLAQIEPTSVVGNAIRAAERLGCVVLPFDSELGRHLGMSVRSDLIPLLCVANSRDLSGDRQRFTVAHELGHLTLHATTNPPGDSAEAARMEAQANRFAAAFLGPGDPLIETLKEYGGRVTLSALLRVKAVWGLSVRSLIGRFKALGVIDADQARSLYKQVSKRGWNQDEPGRIEPESAQWLSRSLTLRAGTDDLRLAAKALARQIGGNTDDLLSLASWERGADAEVVEMSSLRDRSRVPARSGG